MQYFGVIVCCVAFAGLCVESYFTYSKPGAARSVSIIAHRGSSGALPEHTVPAYERAAADGAHYIECDLALTRDLQLICRHESLLNSTTDVAKRAQFADRVTSRVVNGETLHGWFSVDFTLREIKQLRAVQRFDFRDKQYDGKFEIATFDEFIEVAKIHRVGVYPELKDVAWVNSLDIMPNDTRFEDLVLEQLNKHGYTFDDYKCCILQSFEESALLYLRERTVVPLAMLFKTNTTKADLQRYKDNGFFAVGVRKDLVTTYAQAMNGSKPRIAGVTSLITWCHELGLTVHVFTFRNEDRFILCDYVQDPYLEYKHFVELGADGLFTDFPGSLQRFLGRHCYLNGSNTLQLTDFKIFLAIVLLVPTAYFMLNTW